MTQAAIVQEQARVVNQPRDGGLLPTSPLHSLRVEPIPHRLARAIIERHHYLRSMPGGTHLAFGVYLEQRLQGALTLGVGPKNAHCLVEGAKPEDCLTLTRLWLSNELPLKSESRVLSIVLRHVRSHTAVKFLLSYADPSQGHLGIIYQATNWLYTGWSEAMPLYDLGDGKLQHSRSLSHAYGTHSVRHFQQHGVGIKVVPQVAKHRYLYFIDPAWPTRLKVPVLPYPKKGGQG